MSTHRATIAWKRTSPDFRYESYGRAHRWAFPGGVEVAASASPEFRGEPERVDPEQAYVAALASCHMLTLLAIAAHEGVVIDAYDDEAVGFMEKNEAGKLAVTRVVLRPRIGFADPPPPAEVIERLHHRAHEHCFLANSVRTAITVEPR